MIVAKVRCKCSQWVRLRTRPDENNPKHEFAWVLHTHNNGCGRRVELERNGGHGARIIGRCDGQQMEVDVEYEE
jgi:hypothetical protein